MATLYEITGDILQVMDLFYQDEIDEQTMADTIESLKYELDQKAESYCKVIRNMESDKDAIKVEIDRLTSRVDRINKAIERMKTTLFQAMETTNTQKIKTDLFSLSIANRAPQLPKNIEDMDVPKQYYVEQPPKLDKRTLLSDIKAGKVASITPGDLVTGRGLNIR